MKVNIVNYQSRQWVVLLWVFLPVLTIGMVLFDMRGQDLSLLPRSLALIVLINLFALSFFGHLKTEINGKVLTWHFGFFGWPKWQLHSDQIRQVEVCETNWYEGKGIRFTREGMLYNATGRGAVRIYKADGSKVRLGSAEPEVLCEKIRQMISN
jgi:hypothetical protein